MSLNARSLNFKCCGKAKLPYLFVTALSYIFILQMALHGAATYVITSKLLRLEKGITFRVG
jgi:hypothetical protein